MNPAVVSTTSRSIPAARACRPQTRASGSGVVDGTAGPKAALEAPKSALEAMLTDEERRTIASHVLLVNLGGRAFCGERDDETARTIDVVCALELRRQGVATIVVVDGRAVAALVEDDS